MAFQVSPGINVSEIDLTTVVPMLPHLSVLSLVVFNGVLYWREHPSLQKTI